MPFKLTGNRIKSGFDAESASNSGTKPLPYVNQLLEAASILLHLMVDLLAGVFTWHLLSLLTCLIYILHKRILLKVLFLEQCCAVPLLFLLK